MKTKICYKCKKEKPLSEFYKSEGHNKDGLHSWCKVCCTKTTAIRKRKYKEKLVKLFGGKCQKCGYDKCIGALEFHHLDPSKKDPNYREIMKNASFERRKKVLDGCILLCANCHREEHYNN